MHVIVSYTYFFLSFSLHTHTFAEMQEFLLLGRGAARHNECR